VRTQQWYALCDVFERYDALICPTTPIPAPAAERTDASYAGETSDGKMTSTDMTHVFNNVAQCPALSVPAGWSSDGLPMGLQIVGHRFDDLSVLRIGAAVERLRPWADRRPPV
jgi:Asp-tRNA(Asn)/Glu-tRNA(Gln) amidotransferase A subunit family amidase